VSQAFELLLGMKFEDLSLDQSWQMQKTVEV
jgi:hypothetical protein